ncbi:Mannose-6-phosphate isomerase [Smittium culicis]|uniref:Mannose-6-phosphate isomerase n=1 Tax=Smittium culicis TaxID=133412 RepID=A0A1R1X1W6_9FUNG|nr:Mannose-6-phosphate isomerase [Smittium culicis]
MNKIHRLSCVPNNYHWGKLGSESKVAQFMATDPSFKLDEKLSYAELWMGTHPSGMSVLSNDRDVSLAALISQNPSAYLGDKVAQKYNNDLPFLFKILSINTALSIQAHPNKKLAEQLHAERPTVYKDPNHKPEMSIALTDFEALSGFRPLEEIANFVGFFSPELSSLVGKENASQLNVIATSGITAFSLDQQKQILKDSFSSLMKTDPLTVSSHIKLLLDKDVPQTSEFYSIWKLAHRLNTQYPDDIGVFCIFFLNIIHLSPGQAFFMGADEPHAYIYGDCVECMASSDNVVRAGLTPKYRDVDVLVDMLTYQYGPGNDKLTKETQFISNGSPSTYSSLYNPPIEEFSVLKTDLPSPNLSENVNLNGGPAIAIIVDGSGSISVTGSNEYIPATKGNVFFIPNNVQFSFASNSSSNLLAYTAFCKI